MNKDKFYKEISNLNMAPLWDVLSDLVTATPKTRTKAHIWYWHQVMDHVLNAGKIITAKKASMSCIAAKFSPRYMLFWHMPNAIMDIHSLGASFTDS